MAKSTWIVTLVSALALVVAIGCSGSKEPEPVTGTTGTTGGEVETPMVTAEQASAVLTTNCMPCHGGAEPKEGYNLESVENAVETGAITKGDAAGSKIIMAIKGEGGLKKMPPQATVSDSDVKTLEDWINAQS